MSDTPFIPLFVGDFLAKTPDLSDAETGAYLRLIMAQWSRKGASLPDDQARLQRIAHSGRNWPKVWAEIAPFFEKDEAGYFNATCREMFQKRARQAIAKSVSGALGGNAKALNAKERALANATNSLGVCSSNPYPYVKTEEDLPPPPPDPTTARADPHGQKTDRELMLEAMGVDPVSGMTGHGGTRIGTRADMAEAERWLELPGMTVPVVLEEIRRVMASKRDGPPKGFKYFTSAMQKLSGSLTQAPLNPIAPTQGARQNERRAFDKTIRAVAAGMDAGTIKLDTSSRDPLAQLARRDADALQHRSVALLRPGQ